MTTKTPILLILTTKEYCNNFIFTGVLDQLEIDFELTILIPSSLKKPIEGSGYKIDVLPDSVFQQNEKNFIFMADLLRHKYRKKSKSFRYRDKRITATIWKNLKKILTPSLVRLPSGLRSDQAKRLRKSKFPNWFLFITELNKRLVKEVGKPVVRKLIILALAKPFVFRTVFKCLESSVKTPESLDGYLTSNHYTIVVLPSAAFEPTVAHLVKAKSKKSFKLLMIVDNWDNLSSKTVLWQKPDFIATWGPQSSEHAVRIQGFKKSNLFEIGTARFASHSGVQYSNPNQAPIENYVLYVGTFLKYDEYNCVNIISKEINSHPEIYGKLKIIYRPHPFASMDERFHKSELDNVVIDRDITSFQSNTGSFLNFEASIEQQRNARLIVGGLSSMLIESSLLGKNYLALVHKEKMNFESPHRILASYEHFEGISRLPNLYFVKEISELSRMFRSTFLEKQLSTDFINRSLSYFYDTRPIKYGKKLEIVLTQIKNSE